MTINHEISHLHRGRRNRRKPAPILPIIRRTAFVVFIVSLITIYRASK